jgi:heme o synthase
LFLRPQQAVQHARSLTSLDVRTLRLCLYLSVTTLIWAFGLIVIGALVTATDAAADCSGWPLCNGQFSPASDIEGSLIFGHRSGGLVIVLLSLALVALARVRLPVTSAVSRLASAVFVLVLAQAVVGGFAVVQDLPRYAVSAHLILAFAVTGTLTAAIVSIRHRLLNHTGDQHAAIAALPEHLTGYLRAAAIVTIGAVLAISAREPDATASLGRLRDAFGSSGGAIALQYVLLGTLALLALSLLARSWNSQQMNAVSQRLAVIASISMLLAVMAGVAATLMSLPAVLQVAPLTFATLGWTATVALLAGSLQHRNRTVIVPQAEKLQAYLRDFVRVSKPGIMLLLLVTTLGAMLIAQQGWPSIGLIGMTLLGGALASGGASALNCYYDRDIDGVMARTRKRPIPTGGLTPDQVRAWGLALSLLSVVVLAVFVNPLAATMALAGNLFYVMVYTRRLKRTTPQNIVIGGAAGSFPPLVGWAAVTGSLSLGAFLIAAIIFYWTPPHFWSLALLKSNDYKRAGIPMLPVTHGDHETRRRIVLYSFLLLAVTLLMVPAGVVGFVYGATAAVLGTWFVAMAIRMYRENTSRLAWPLFKYSNYYLAALLAAMAIDHAVGL